MYRNSFSSLCQAMAVLIKKAPRAGSEVTYEISAQASMWVKVVKLTKKICLDYWVCRCGMLQICAERGCFCCWELSHQLIHILLITDMVVEHWNRGFGCETIHVPNKSLLQWIFLQKPCLITRAWSFLTSEVVEADRGQKHHILAHPLAL